MANKEKGQKCQFCEKSFSRRYHLKRHLEKIHKKQVEFRNANNQICPICAVNIGKNLDELQVHLQKLHNIQIEEETLHFKTVEDFEKWKRNEEKISKAIFIKKTMTVERNSIKFTTYYCNRSGTFKSNSKGRRNIKSLGSNKINATCPARMKAKVFTNSSVEVSYVKTHSGHTMDVARMRITADEKKSIADKLAQNVSITQILDDVKNKVDSQLERIHLLNRRDVINIAASYNLKNEEIYVKEKRQNKISVDPGVQFVVANDCVTTDGERGVGTFLIYSNVNH